MLHGFVKIDKWISSSSPTVCNTGKRRGGYEKEATILGSAVADNMGNRWNGDLPSFSNDPNNLKF